MQHSSTPRRLRSQTAACLWIPDFALMVECARRRPVGRSIALLSPSDSRRVWQVSYEARARGVRSGMTLGQAIGLVADLVVYEPDPAAYTEQFGRLHTALHDVSPVVEAGGGEHTGRFFVGMDGLEPLYGGAEAQLAQIERVCRRATPELAAVARIHLGWGRGKFVAWVAAATGRPHAPVVIGLEDTMPFLSRQPVHVLPVPRTVIERLERLGLTTLGEIAALPEPALASQFGRQGKRLWRYAAGRALRPVRAELPEDPVTVALDLAAPTNERDFLYRALDRLVLHALGHGKRGGRSVRAVRLLGRLELGGSWSAKTIYKEPTSDRVTITRPLRHRIETDPPQRPVIRLALQLTAFGPCSIEQQLFRQDESSAARADSLESLRDITEQLRLRDMKLFRIMELAPWSRIPERRHALVDYDP